MAADSANGAVNGGASYAERHDIADHFIGGNRLANAPASKVKDFVAAHDGHTVITNVSRAFSRPLSAFSAAG
jgi:acetyl-CoA carboxylase/biotin carboxylase 1